MCEYGAALQQYYKNLATSQGGGSSSVAAAGAAGDGKKKKPFSTRSAKHMLEHGQALWNANMGNTLEDLKKTNRELYDERVSSNIRLGSESDWVDSTFCLLFSHPLFFLAPCLVCLFVSVQRGPEGAFSRADRHG